MMRIGALAAARVATPITVSFDRAKRRVYPVLILCCQLLQLSVYTHRWVQIAIDSVRRRSVLAHDESACHC